MWYVQRGEHRHTPNFEHLLIIFQKSLLAWRRPTLSKNGCLNFLTRFFLKMKTSYLSLPLPPIYLQRQFCWAVLVGADQVGRGHGCCSSLSSLWDYKIPRKVRKQTSVSFAWITATFLLCLLNHDSTSRQKLSNCAYAKYVRFYFARSQIGTSSNDGGLWSSNEYITTAKNKGE